MAFQFRLPHIPPGPTQRLILHRAYEAGDFITIEKTNEQTSARKLMDNGYLDRHRKSATTYRLSEYGRGYMDYMRDRSGAE